MHQHDIVVPKSLALPQRRIPLQFDELLVVTLSALLALDAALEFGNGWRVCKRCFELVVELLVGCWLGAADWVAATFLVLFHV